MKNPCVASQPYWESLYNCLEKYLKYEPDAMLFADIFKKFIKPGGTCFEVGCYPGNNLLYFAREFGYSVSGIDITPRIYSKMQKYFEANGVKPDELICDDYLTYQSSKTYDLVCSFGFVEHFRNFEEIISRHIKMVTPGGILIITCPNLAGLQYFLHLLIDRKYLPAHVISSMSLRKWRKVLEGNNMKLLYHNYYKTAGFVRGPDVPRFLFQRRILQAVTRILDEIDKRISFPNPLLSPWLISISQRIS
ncbi:MAG: class I SAM-dependent methyltransferase [Candidatus Scalindua sp.]